MSVDVLISPRISFSHDIIEAEDHEPSIPIESYPYSSPSMDTALEFDFAFRIDHQGALIRESSTADELFSNGKLLPISIDFGTKTEITNTRKPDLLRIQSFQDYCSPSPVLPSFEIETEQGKKEEKKQKKIIKSLKEHLEDNTDIEEEEEEEEERGEGGGQAESPPLQATVQPSVIRGFWKFGRSNSLNCRSYGRNRAKLSIPSKLKILSRSKSTGGGDACLSTNPVEEEEEETKPTSPSPPPQNPPLMPAGRSFWKFSRSNSLDCDKSCQNRGSLIGSLKVILLRSNSTGEVLAKRRFDNSNEGDRSHNHQEQGVKQIRIRRSCSLNFDGKNHGRRLIMGSRSLLGRSNSTGSTPNSKQIGISNDKKELQKQNSAKSSSPCSANPASWKKKGQGRKSFRDYYGNYYTGERVNPVLNIPSPYISRASVDLLGFGSLFCNGKYKKKRK